MCLASVLVILSKKVHCLSVPPLSSSTNEDRIVEKLRESLGVKSWSRPGHPLHGAEMHMLCCSSMSEGSLWNCLGGAPRKASQEQRFRHVS